MTKKEYTKSTSNTADKFFSESIYEKETNGTKQTNVLNNTNDTKHTNVSNNTNDTKHTNVLNNTNDTKHTNVSNNTNDTKHTNVLNNTNDTKHTNVKNKSQQYDERGKRSQRYGLLMDKQLSNDLKNLSKATGNKSLNDFIITILIDFVDTPNNQKRLKIYDELLKL